MSDAPQTVGKYQLLSKLGSGGMAEVFEARTATGELVALKTIRPSLRGDPAFMAMFLNEARIASLLRHPHVVQVIEVDEISGIPVIAMERIHGACLSELVTRQRPRRTPPAIAAALMAGVAEALHHAHAVATTAAGEKLQVVHRDVSPQNIMVADDGRVLLLDFGVAKAQGAPGFLKSSGDLLKGKVRYMAPELVESGQASPLTDLFAAGAVLFELVTGEPLNPAQGDAELLTQVLSGKHRPVSELAPECPLKLVELIEWAVQPRPAERCPSAGAWAEALRAFVASVTPPPGQAEIAAWARAIPPTATPAAPVIAVPAAPSRPALDLTAPPTLPNPVVHPSSQSRARPATQEMETEIKPRVLPPTGETTAVVAAPPRKKPPESPSRIAALALAFVVVLVVGVVLGEIDPSTPVIRVSAPPHGPPPKSPFVLYLDAAEAALTEGRFDSAREEVELAKKLGSPDARDNLRLVELSSRVEREGGPLRIRSLIKLGDLDGARTQLRFLAEHDPDLAMIEQLSKEIESHRPVVSPSGDGGAPVPASSSPIGDGGAARR